jgi:phospholipid/cholesterol/gamma-HCH transport system substrate-binding protein
MQGVTGLLFINLKQDPNGDATAPLKQGEHYPMIESLSSDFDVLLASLPELVGRASSLIDHVDSIFSEKNVTAVSQTLENLRATSQGLPATATKVAELVDQLKVTLDEVHGAAAGIRGIAEDSRPEIQQALQRLNTAADNLSTTTANVNKFVTSAEVQVGHLSEQGLFELERLLRDSRAAAIEFRELSRSLKQQPSQLIYEKPNSGTEIRR